MASGFLNLLKPPGMTSSDAVVWVRRMLGEKRIGHAGTLDPEAAGVLPLCVGRATKLFDILADKDKTYLALLCLGVVTDTQDAQGREISRADASGVTAMDVKAALAGFTGDLMQIPPAYAAVRVDGKRLYEYAHAGKSVEARPRPVRVHGIELLEERPEGFLLRVECGKGTYVRTLCHDIGQALGVGGHMGFLARVQAGPFTIDSAVSVEELKRAHEAGETARLLWPMDAPLMHLPALHVPDSQHKRLVNGGAMERVAFPDAMDGSCRLYRTGAFAGVGGVAGAEVRLRIHLMEAI